MAFPVTSYVVFLHNGDAGTFAPAFPDLDSAEEFANAMRAITSNIVVSEPCPVLATQEINYKLRASVEN
jgi:hypothetical protein